MGFFSWITHLFGKSKNPSNAFVPPYSRIVPSGFRYLKASAVLEFHRFQSFQEYTAPGDQVFHDNEQTPALILFISHRWESPGHPDPAAQQLKAIQYLLQYIPMVASLMKGTSAERLRQMPTLRSHGIIHAALLLGSTDENPEDEDNIWRDWARVVKEKAPSELLEHIGIWYDYSCLPQASEETNKRIRGELFESLTQLPDLVRSSAILIIREENDDYSERGWCASEIAAARRDNQLIVLRKDLLGAKITDSDLSPADENADKNAPDYFFSSAGIFRSALKHWESETIETPSLWNLYIGLADIKIREESRDFPLLTTKRNPEAFPQQKEILSKFIGILGRLSAFDEQNGGLNGQFDLAITVRDVMKQIGLKCSEEWDVVFVGLSILRSRHHPKLVPTVEQFYRTAIERWINGESMKLSHFRERRENLLSWEVWFIFEGESPNARKTPHWIKS